MSAAAADWSAYDRPELRAAIATGLPGGREEVLLVAEGMHCASCVGRLRKLLGPQVQDLRINLASRMLEFVHDPQRQALSSLLAQIDAAGFEPQVLAQDADRARARRRRRTELVRIGVAVIGAMQVMMLAWPTYFDGGAIEPDIAALMRWAQLLLATPVVLYSGWPFLAGGWRALRARVPTMDLPVALSLLIAWAASALRVFGGEGELYFDAATMFVMLLGLARWFEGHSRSRAGERMRLLAGRRPLTAVREHDGGAETVPLAALRAGDRLRVAPGEALPADGELLDETAQLDESLLSGESRPVLHRRGDAVLAGSLNLAPATLRLQVREAGAGTRLAQITRLLQQAQDDRPRVQLLADRYAGHFVLAVMALALAGAWYWWPQGIDKALGVALAVLVASCPCALSLAVPTVHAAASSLLARHGVLMARPRALARLTQVDTVLFDKTGTLTRPELTVAQVLPLAEPGIGTCRRLAAALERELTHPIARALAAGVTGLPQAQDIRLQAGGVSGCINGRRYWIGAAEQAPQPVALPSGPQASQASWLLLCEEQRPLALFGLRAELRPEAQRLIAVLRRQGLAMELLTGDAEAPARALGAQAGIATLRSRQTPEQKLARLRELQAQGRVVMAVGDGINDAPFLSAADVAVAMPQGAALAQARADVVLVGDSLSGLGTLRSVARQAQRRLRQNLAWALGYNLVVLPLALGGWLTPWLAALGMSLSSLLVVGNALRLHTGEH